MALNVTNGVGPDLNLNQLDLGAGQPPVTELRARLEAEQGVTVQGDHPTPKEVMDTVGQPTTGIEAQVEVSQSMVTNVTDTSLAVATQQADKVPTDPAACCDKINALFHKVGERQGANAAEIDAAVKADKTIAWIGRHTGQLI